MNHLVTEIVKSLELKTQEFTDNDHLIRLILYITYIVPYKLTIFIQVYGRIQELPVDSNLWPSSLGQTTPLSGQRIWPLASPVCVISYRPERLTRDCWIQDMALLV